MQRIKLYDLIDSELAVKHEQAEHVYEVLCELLTHGQTVLLDFSEIVIVPTYFLNEAVGQLAEHLTQARLSQLLLFDGATMTPNQQEHVTTVMQNVYRKLEATDASTLNQ